jgi:MFS family permease
VAKPLLERLGLSRPELRGWVSYDWANSVFMTSVVQVFQVYFASVAAKGLTRADASAKFYLATSVASIVVALMGPFVGALADYSGTRKRIMGGFIALGVLATFGIAFVHEGEWRSGIFWYALANIGIAVSFILYDSLLPHVARPEEVDLVSSAGYALGYLSGGLCMALNLLWIANPQAWGFADAGSATRASFAFAAVWWALFSIPLFRNVPEPPSYGGAREERSFVVAVTGTLASLKATFQDLRRYREAFVMMIAFLVYNDGINTVIKVGATYGTEMGIPQASLLQAILAVQFIGLPCAYAYSRIASSFGTRRRHLPGARELLRHLPRGLHDDRDVALLRARSTHRHRAGGRPGAVPVALCEPHPQGEVLRVLRLLWSGRALRGNPRAGALLCDGDAHRFEPWRDPRPRGVLRGGGGAALTRGCGARPAAGRSSQRRRARRRLEVRAEGCHPGCTPHLSIGAGGRRGITARAHLAQPRGPDTVRSSVSRQTVRRQVADSSVT